MESKFNKILEDVAVLCIGTTTIPTPILYQYDAYNKLNWR